LAFNTVAQPCEKISDVSTANATGMHFDDDIIRTTYWHRPLGDMHRSWFFKYSDFHRGSLFPSYEPTPDMVIMQVFFIIKYSFIKFIIPLYLFIGLEPIAK
jgi:hypothetical protein